MYFWNYTVEYKISPRIQSEWLEPQMVSVDVFPRSSGSRVRARGWLPAASFFAHPLHFIIAQCIAECIA